jgi:transposase
MYLEGLGFRRIGRILQISYGTVFAWVKKWSLTMFVPRREGRVRKVELEKLIAYAESRKGTRYGLLLIDLKDNVSLLSLDKPAGRDKVQA